MSIRRKIISDSGWVFFCRISGALVGLAFFSLLTRLLPPEDVGTYFLALSTATVLSVFVGLGLPRTSTRLLAEATAESRYNPTRKIIIWSLAFTLVAGALVALFYLSFLSDWLSKTIFDNETLATLRIYVAGWCVLLALRQLVAESFRGIGNVKLASVFGGLVSNSATTTLLAVTLFLGINTDLSMASSFTLFGLLLSTGLAIAILFQQTSTAKNHNSTPPPQILVIAIPIMLTDIAQVILSQSNIWILGGVTNDTEVALYGTVMQIALLISFPFIIVNNTIPQLLVKFKVAGQHDKLERLLQTVATAALLPALLIVLAMIMLGRPLLEFIYGASYTDGYPALVWLSVGQLVNVLTGPCGVALMLTGHQNTNMAITVITGIFSIPLSFLLSARYGATGAAASAASAMAVQNIALAILAKRKIGVRTHATISRRILAQFRTRT